MSKHILVPLDGSSFGEAALRPALAIARRTRARVTLVSVQDLRAASATELRYEARAAYLERIRRECGPMEGSVGVTVGCGHPADQILALAESSGADLIVMSTHGRGGVSRLWLGSVADQCLRHAHVPLLLTRPQPSGQLSGDRAFLPNRVVVPLDGTDGAERALGEATRLAVTFRVPIALVRVIDCERGADRPRPDAAAALAAARAYLNAVSTRLRGRGVPVTAVAIPDRHPASTIIAEAAADMIVMATHARTGLERALLGSVADKVSRGARGAVVLVPPRKAASAGATLRVLDGGAGGASPRGPLGGPLPRLAQ
jgi:nucleotide-binding universal stress UspA family protein